MIKTWSVITFILALVATPALAASGLVYVTNEKNSDITVLDGKTFEVLRTL